MSVSPMQQSVRTRMLEVRVGAPTNTRTLLYLVLLASALVVGAVSVWQLRQAWAKDALWMWLPLLAAMIAGAYSLRQLELWLPGEPVFPRLKAYPPKGRRELGIIFLSASALVTVFVILRLVPDYTKWQGVIAYWFIALALLLAGAWFLGAVGRASPRAATELSLWAATRRNRWLEAGAFGLILALAIFLRTYRLDSIPPGIYVDETNGALDALHILEGRADSPFGTGWYQTPTGYSYYMAAIFGTLGANWTSLKLVSLIPAILTIPAVYLLARLLFGPFAGLSAMLFMAVSRWHLSMSRWGWNETAPPLFQVLACYFLIRGLRERRAFDYALSGFLTGLNIYTYLSSRLALLTLVLFVFYWFWSDPNGWRVSLRRSGLGILITLLALCVTVAPIGVTYATNPFLFNNRVSEISVLNDVRTQGDLTPLLLNIGDILKFFHQTGDLQAKHNLPGEPMTDPITGLLFAIGVAYAILGWRDQRRMLLLLWLVIGLAGSYLSSHHESPQSYRTLTALPAVVIMAADVLDKLVRALYRTLREQRFAAKHLYLPTLAAGGLALLALGGAAFWESNVYFGAQASSIDVQRGFNPTENGVARETIAAVQSGKTVYLSPRFSAYSPLRFLLYGVMKAKTGKNTLEERPYHVIMPEVNLPLPDDGQDALVLLDSDYWTLRDYITAFYPDAQMELVKLANDSPIYMRLQLTHDQISRIQGLTRRVTYADGRSEESAVSGVEFVPGDAQVSRVTWEGGLYVAHGGDYELFGQDGVQVSLDGLAWSGRHYLGKGLYTLHLEWKGEGTPGLEWSMAGGKPSPLPAGTLFRIPERKQGLLASYYDNTNWEGVPLFHQVTPFLLFGWTNENPIVSSSAFTVRFRGALHVTEPGSYQLRVVADDGARLVLDDTVLGEALRESGEHSFEVTKELAQGDHPMMLDYIQRGGGSALRVFWRRGDGLWTPIPPAALVPARP